MALLSLRFLTETQRERCCRDGLSTGVIGYALHTIDEQRIGVVDDILVDDESLVIRYLVVDTSSAAFTLNQPHLLLPADLCCWDTEQKTARSRASVAQAQSAPVYDRVVALTQAYEDTVITHFGERPYAPSDT